MTTVTEPPLIDEPSIGVDQLPALDQPDERVCTMRNGWDEQCNNPAAWAITGRCDTSGCRTTRVLICQDCQANIANGLRCKCRRCQLPVRITWIEPIR